MDIRIHNLLMQNKDYTPYKYEVEGIIFKKGLVWTNLTKDYKNNPDGVEDFLERVIEDSENYRLTRDTKSVIKDLKNNY